MPSMYMEWKHFIIGDTSIKNNLWDKKRVDSLALFGTCGLCLNFKKAFYRGTS